MSKYLWRKVDLENSMVYDWERFVDTIDQQRTDILDTTDMLIPTEVEDFNNFWLRFAHAMKRAQKLKFIELYKCPAHVVEQFIYSLPGIEELNATSLRSSNLMENTKNPHDLMYLNLSHLGQMTNLTDLRIKGSTGIKLTALPSFENLIHLNRFSLTSIKAFPKHIYQSLNTITENIRYFEIGDCECLTKDFAVSLKRFVKLLTLRLENCYNRWDKCAQDVFTAIRGLPLLINLELVNIEFSNRVKDELEKWDGDLALLIIPTNMSLSATTNSRMIDCFKKLSAALTHLVWVFTEEFLHAIDLIMTDMGNNSKETTKHIAILRTSMPQHRPEDGATTEEEKDKSDNVDFLSLPDLKKLLNTIMPDTKVKVISVSFSQTVYLSDQFCELWST